MPAGDMVQKGTTVVVGFNGRTFGTCLMEVASEEQVGEIKEIRGANNAAATKLISNPARRVTVEGILLSGDLTTVEALKRGDVASIDGISCMVEEVKISFNREEAKVSITAIKEDSMTYT